MAPLSSEVPIDLALICAGRGPVPYIHSLRHGCPSARPCRAVKPRSRAAARRRARALTAKARTELILSAAKRTPTPIGVFCGQMICFIDHPSCGGGFAAASMVMIPTRFVVDSTGVREKVADWQAAVSAFPYGFGEVRVATLALLTFIVVVGPLSGGVVMAKFSGHVFTFRSDSLFSAKKAAQSSTLTGRRSSSHPDKHHRTTESHFNHPVDQSAGHQMIEAPAQSRGL